MRDWYEWAFANVPRETFIDRGWTAAREESAVRDRLAAAMASLYLDDMRRTDAVQSARAIERASAAELDAERLAEALRVARQALERIAGMPTDPAVAAVAVRQAARDALVAIQSIGGQ